jgi:hypothetical protein
MLLDSESFAGSTNITDYITYGYLNTLNRQVAIGTGGVFNDNYMMVGPHSTVISTINMRPTTSNLTTFFVGNRLLVTTNIASQAMAFLDNLGNTQFTLNFNQTTGAMTLYRGANVTLLATSPAGTFTPGNPFYCEVGATIDPSAGSIQVRVNNTTISSLTYSGNTNGDSGNLTFCTTQWQGGSNVFGGQGLEVQHYYVCDSTGAAPDNTFLGDVRVGVIAPVSNGTVAFTPNGLGSNWQNAAKIPPVPATDFNSDGTVGAQDILNMGTIPGNLPVIFGLQTKALMNKTTAGIRSAAAQIVSGGTVVSGPTTSLGSTSSLLRAMTNVDPATGLPWTLASVPQVAYEVIS